MRRTSRLSLAVALAAALAACARRPEPKPEAITLSVPYELDTLDPHARNRLSEFALLSNLYEPLVTSDATMSLKPCLAERWDNPDLVTWVFHLRPGVRFHDGAPLTADDVVASLGRLLANPELEMGGYVWNLDRVRAIDPSTVEVRTLSPMSILLNKLRFVLITRNGGEASLATAPDGTGPYRFVSWKRGEEIRFARNDAYWGPRPPLASAVARLSRPPERALEDLASGRSGLVQCAGKALEEKARSLPGVRVHHQSSIFVKFLGFDFRREKTPFCDAPTNPFKDHRVREAVSLAIDRGELVRRLSSSAVPARQAVPPFIFGFDSNLPELPYDPGRAKKLLADAGFPNGFGVTLHARKVFGEAPALLAEMLSRVGVRVTVAALADPQFFDVVATHGSSFYFSRFGCPTGDASDILENAVHSVDLPRRFGRSNDGEYASPELDRLIEESAAILDMERRRPVLQKALAAVTNDLALVPLYVDQDVYAVKAPFTWQPRNDNFLLASEVGVR
jgi:peptide/nickel transport system substrate-binding protein